MPELGVHVFNVGQGDSILLEFPDGSWGVVDCCQMAEFPEPPALSYLKQKRVEALAFVCLTHPHDDHYSGLSDILTAYRDKVDEMWIFRLDSVHWRTFLQLQHQTATTPLRLNRFNELHSIFKDLEKLRRKNKIRLLDANQRLLNFGGVEIDCLAPHPPETIAYQQRLAKFLENPSDYRADENLLSAVLRLRYGESVVILGADATRRSWGYILQESRKRRESLEAKLVKVSHHGSKDSFHEIAWDILSRRKQTHAAISAGARYGHPHREVISSLFERQVRLHCTNYPVHCLKTHRLDLSKYDGLPEPVRLQLMMLDLDSSSQVIPCDGDLHFTLHANGNFDFNHQQQGFCPFHI